MNRVTDAYREMRAPADAHGQALSRFAARRSIRRVGWLPVAGFASAVGLAVLIAPDVWYAPDTQSVAGCTRPGPPSWVAPVSGGA